MLAAKQTFVYRAVGGLSLRADVYAGSGPLPRPVIVWMHGGALISGHREGISPAEVDVYCGVGYAVVSVDYRLAPETKLGEMIADVRAAFAWVRTRGPELFGADPDRVAAMGPSAGGYLTLMAGFHVKPRLQALVAIAGYGDIVGDWYARPDPFYLRQPEVTEEDARGAVGERETVGNPGRQDVCSPRQGKAPLMSLSRLDL